MESLHWRLFTSKSQVNRGFTFTVNPEDAEKHDWKEEITSLQHGRDRHHASPTSTIPSLKTSPDFTTNSRLPLTTWITTRTSPPLGGNAPGWGAGLQEATTTYGCSGFGLRTNFWHQLSNDYCEQLYRIDFLERLPEDLVGISR
jgi:hypothetical protein